MWNISSYRMFVRSTEYVPAIRKNTFQPYEKSTSRTSSAAKSLSTTPELRFLPGLPETVREVLQTTTAEKFFKSGFGQNDSPDFFLALVQADTSKWLNAIKQRALSLATLHIRDRIVYDGYRGEKGYCNLAAKDVLVRVAAAYNPEFSGVRISKLITENIDRGTRYSQLALETSLSAAFSLCPDHAWWYEKRIPKSKDNEARKTFVSKLRAEGAKTDAEINEEFEQLRKADQINKDVEFARRFQTKIQEILGCIYARCDAWLESGEHSAATAETMRCLVESSERAKGQRNRHDTAPAPIQVLMSDNGATSVEIASNADLLSTPPVFHHESLDVLANTALLQAQSQNAPSHSYADHHCGTEAADATTHQARAATTLSLPSSAASLFDSSLQPHHLHARSSDGAALPSNNGQKRLYDGEEASTTKRQKSVPGPTASGLNNGVEAVMAGGLDDLGPDLGDCAESTPSQQTGFVDQWDWSEVIQQPTSNHWNWYMDGTDISLNTGNQFRDEELTFSL
ncbi:hypothetical protein CCM_05074 [Cordyceps militaris CM01]|uniref:Uncharacterized protein n=1 Tax=Cordyceps militaris (strain CM01) TaxID=983644 RepID=G3JHL0_CORMM|nr:uncharacterized protein CCM_05074 [Cordyceps militaris CM01]EGX90918.1 hypothetical protein CCM_05074 [Cordyceps militaris CM01]